MGAALLLISAEDFGRVLVAYVGLGAGLGGFMMSAQSLVLEFGSRANLPMRIAVSNSAAEAVGVAAPILGGVLATTLGYEALVAVAVGFKALAFAVTVFFVDEPRHRTEQPL
jgi:MFS family permease